MLKLYNEVIVCYDVENNKRRKKLFDGLKDIGLFPAQKSVFHGYVNYSDEKNVMLLFQKVLDENLDKAFIVRTKIKQNIKKISYGHKDYDFRELKDYETI